eukprot:1542865-Amphidinium_carterae.1
MRVSIALVMLSLTFGLGRNCGLFAFRAMSFAEVHSRAEQLQRRYPCRWRLLQPLRSEGVPSIRAQRA